MARPLAPTLASNLALTLALDWPLLLPLDKPRISSDHELIFELFNEDADGLFRPIPALRQPRPGRHELASLESYRLALVEGLEGLVFGLHEKVLPRLVARIGAARGIDWLYVLPHSDNRMVAHIAADSNPVTRHRRQVVPTHIHQWALPKEMLFFCCAGAREKLYS